LSPNSSDNLGEMCGSKYVIYLVHRGIGNVWDVTSKLFECNERIADLLQLIEYSEIFENEFLRLIVSYDDEGSCKYISISSV